VFNSRTFFGTIAAAGVLVVSVAAPALASDKPTDHPAKPIDIIGTVLKPVQGVIENGTPASSALNNTPAGSLLGALSAIPLVGPLFSAFSSGVAGGASDENPITGTLHGLSTGTGLSSVASGFGGAVGGTIDSIAKAIPGGSTVTGLLPGGSVTGTLNGITNGALSGLTNAVPGLGSLSNGLGSATGWLGSATSGLGSGASAAPSLGSVTNSLPKLGG
jgi:hypothetical protein